MNDLKILNVSNNKIGQVHMNAFDGLNQLKTLDLSFNALGYILEHWFRSLTSLRELYLRGNILGTSINDVQINSESLLVRNKLSFLLYFFINGGILDFGHK